MFALDAAIREAYGRRGYDTLWDSSAGIKMALFLFLVMGPRWSARGWLLSPFRVFTEYVWME
jgi:hypothetical protein